MESLKRDHKINPQVIRISRQGKLFPEISALVKFGLVGACGSAIMLGLMYLLTEYGGLYYLVSYLIGFSAALLSSYCLNTLWTFRQKVKWQRLAYYVIINFFTIMVNELVVFAATLLGLWYIYSALIGVLVAFALNYRISRSVVWKVLPVPAG